MEIYPNINVHVTHCLADYIIICVYLGALEETDKKN